MSLRTVQSKEVKADSLYTRWSPSWTDQAACRSLPLKPFFPEFDGLPEDAHLDASWPAKLVCWSCPVKIECLEQAWVMEDEYGVFGGLTPMERQRTNLLGYTAREAVSQLEAQVLGDEREEVAV